MPLVAAEGIPPSLLPSIRRHITDGLQELLEHDRDEALNRIKARRQVADVVIGAMVRLRAAELALTADKNSDDLKDWITLAVRVRTAELRDAELTHRVGDGSPFKPIADHINQKEE